MDCGIKGCDKPAVNTYSYGAPLKPSPYGEKLIVEVPLCKDHSKGKPDTLSREELK
jgi:hypothetical protein